jgi:hypothetical protein
MSARSSPMCTCPDPYKNHARRFPTTALMTSVSGRMFESKTGLSSLSLWQKKTHPALVVNHLHDLAGRDLAAARHAQNPMHGFNLSRSAGAHRQSSQSSESKTSTQDERPLGSPCGHAAVRPSGFAGRASAFHRCEHALVVRTQNSTRSFNGLNSLWFHAACAGESLSR